MLSLPWHAASLLTPARVRTHSRYQGSTLFQGALSVTSRDLLHVVASMLMCTCVQAVVTRCRAFGAACCLFLQGMPVFGDTSGKRGALHVRFRVCFPSQLSTHQQQMLRQALSDADEQALCAVSNAAAAVATAAGLLPKPQAGLPLLPSPAGAQEEQPQHNRVQDRQGFAWVAAKSSWQRAATAVGGLSGSPGSSASAWTAAVAFGGGQGGVSAFAQAAGTGPCSAASSSSSAGPATCVQSTGSSKQPLGGVSQRPPTS